MVELVLIGLGSTVTAVLAALLLDRLLDFDLLSARADDDQGQLED
jgi:hypothetical protein